MQPHQQERIAARVKKSQIRPGLHLWHDLPPHFAHGFNQCGRDAGFQIRLRARLQCIRGMLRDGAPFSTRQQGLALQALAVGLARGTQRDILHHKKAGRAHVVGQQGRKLRADASQIKPHAALRQQKGLKRRVFANAPHPHHRLRDAPAAPKRRLDLAKLNAVAANFHLIIVAPEVFNAAIGQPAPQITRTVHAAAGGKGIVHKTLSREFRPVQIASGNLYARNIYLTRYAQRHRVLAGIQHVQPGIADRAANGYRMGRRVQAGLPRHVHGSLGGSVEIVQLHLQLIRMRQGVPPRHKLAG